MKITDISARKILASKGDWTIETTLVLEDGSYGIASVPAGISTGKAEAKTLEVGDSVILTNDSLSKELIDKDFATLKDFDSALIALDGTPDKSKLGGNTTLSLSLAFAKASAMFKDESPLYIYLSDIIGSKYLKIPELLVLMFEGGMHARSLLSIQEFMVHCKTVEDGLKSYQRVNDAMNTRNLPTTVGFEGAFSPPNFTNENALDLLSSLFGPGSISLDVADSYTNGAPLDFEDIISKYAPLSIEDPFDEEAWDSWEVFNKNNSSKTLVVADDLVVTNKIRLQKVIEKHAAGAVVVKANQIGTLSETLEFVQLARQAKLKIIVSHRGEETTDDWLADLAVAVGADYVKFGGFARGERISKYNRLLQIIDDLR
ncbi:MAG: hypothetical protein NT141_03715 [candidate division WWE3 bacterium]|nr:hypothetical protein [candidate division WWE3 bacterium]